MAATSINGKTYSILTKPLRSSATLEDGRHPGIIGTQQRGHVMLRSSATLEDGRHPVNRADLGTLGVKVAILGHPGGWPPLPPAPGSLLRVMVLRSSATLEDGRHEIEGQHRGPGQEVAILGHLEDGRHQQGPGVGH